MDKKIFVCGICILLALCIAGNVMGETCTYSPAQNLYEGMNNVTFQTPHNYVNNMNCYSNAYVCPAGTLAKVYAKYDLESGYDYFYVYDYDSGKYTRWTGTSNGYVWLAPSSTDVVRFRFTSDYSIVRWGIDVKQINCYRQGTTTTSTKPTTSTVNPTTTTTTTIPNTCYDSDGGFAIYTRGNVSGYYSGAYYSYLDFCVSNQTLTEFSCSGTSPRNATYSCSTNQTYCLNGACILATTTTTTTSTTTTTPDSCSDSDGGIVLFELGNVAGYSGGTFYNITDACMYNNTMLLEQFCSGSTPRNYSFNCLNESTQTTHCYNGACV